MDFLPKTEASLFSASLTCDSHKNILEYICLNQECLEKGLFFCCNKCFEDHQKGHPSKLIKVEKTKAHSFDFGSGRKSDASACLSSLSDLNGKFIIILETIRKNMIEKCQANQKMFLNSFERVFKKLWSDSSASTHSFLSMDLTLTKIQTPFYSRPNNRNSEFKLVNQFYRDFSNKFEKFKKMFSSLIENSNKFDEMIQEFVFFMDTTYNKTISVSTNESDCQSFSASSNESLVSIFKNSYTLPILHQNEIMDLNFLNLPDENGHKIPCLASCSKDRSLKIFDLKNKKLKQNIENLPHHLNQMAYCEESNVLAASLSNDTVKLWRYDKSFLMQEDLKGHTGTVWGLQFIQNGTKLVSSSFDSTFRIWNLDKGMNEFKKTHLFEGKVYGVTYLPDLKLIAVSGQNSIFLYDERDPRTSKISFKQAHSEQITKLDYSLNYTKNVLASCGKDGKVKIWDLCKAEMVEEYSHDDYVYGLNFLNPEKLIASASDDKTLKVWNLEEHKLIKICDEHTNFVKTCQWNSDLRILASAGNDKKIIVRSF